MTDRTRRKTGERARVTTAMAAHEGEEAERALGRAVAMGLPLACVAGAILVGTLSSVGSAVLVLASGALLGAIALLWASVRTLTGDAPLPEDLEALAAQHRDVDALAEHKRRVLMALKDLQNEHALGKIDDADYAEIATQYRDQAKVVMREMDRVAAPALAEAERIASEYLAKKGLVREGTTAPAVSAPRPVEVESPGRRICPGCATSNEPDAAFCKKCGSTMTGSGAATSEENDATT